MTKEETWHRRHAVMLAGQLPERIEDVRIILLHLFLAKLSRRSLCHAQ
jgi:hypothetical protein